MVEKTAVALLALAFLLGGCSSTPEARLRKMLATQKTGTIHLPSGVIEVDSELHLAPGAHDLELIGSGTLLKASDDFQGRAILIAEDVNHVRLREFSIDGNRGALAKPLEMVPPENAFRVYYRNNGVYFDRVDGIEISDVRFSSVANFAVLIGRSSAIRISKINVEDSGSLNAHGRNNTTGGVVIEEGSSDFEVRDSTFHRIRGNGLWTHSLYTSARLKDGVFAGNRFDTIGRDAIEIAHATNIRVEDNTGTQIGYPADNVDYENLGTPVAIDTAGNVDHTTYARNKFEEVDGKCIDLDGFHDGSVVENSCVNRGRAENYPFGHFGIVMNNTNPDMQSANVEIRGNRIDGAKFGALFLMGTGHRVIDNVFEHINTAGCNESAAKFVCIYKKDEPKMLESGIYLGRGVVRMQETRDNVIRGNKVSGHKMDMRCIAAGPGVSLRENTIEANTCSDYTLARK